MKKNKISVFLALILTLSFLTTGCGTQKSPQKPNVNNRIENRIGRDRPNNKMDTNLKNNSIGRDVDRDRNRNRNMNINRDISDRAENIARKVSNLDEVNKATAVVSGNTAIVGINMKNNLEGKMTTDLKRRVEKVVKNTDKDIKTVSVTADADLYKRLRNMARDIRSGKPVSGFSREIQEILRRITPNM